MNQKPEQRAITDMDALVLLLYSEALSHRAVPDEKVDRVSRLAAAAKAMRDGQGLQSRIIDIFANIGNSASLEVDKAKSPLKLVFSADEPKNDERACQSPSVPNGNE